MESADTRRKLCIERYERAKADIYDLVYARRWWFRLGEVIESNDGLPKEDNFYAVLGDWYAKYVAVGIRRHVDRGRQTSSLVPLLRRLDAEPEVPLSAADLRGRYPSFLRANAEAERDQALPPGWASRLADELEAAGAPVKGYVDKHVAHLDRVDSPATFRDLHAALDVLVKALLTVEFALTGSAPSPESFCKATEQFDWARSLRVPWVTDGNWSAVRDT